MSLIEVLREDYKLKKFVNVYKFTDGKKYFDDQRKFHDFDKLVKKYNLEFEAFDFSFINLRNGQGRLIIEKRNGDVITHEFEL